MDHFEDRWWEPGELLEAAHAIRRSKPDDEFFCDSAYQPVREPREPPSVGSGSPGRGRNAR